MTHLPPPNRTEEQKGQAVLIFLKNVCLRCIFALFFLPLDSEKSKAALSGDEDHRCSVTPSSGASDSLQRLCVCFFCFFFFFFFENLVVLV